MDWRHGTTTMLALLWAAQPGMAETGGSAPISRDGVVSVAMTGDMIQAARRLTADRGRPVSAWRVGEDVALVLIDGAETGALWLLADDRAVIGSLFDGAGNDLTLKVLTASGLVDPDRSRTEPHGGTSSARPGAASAAGASATANGEAVAVSPANSPAAGAIAAAISPAQEASILLGDPAGIPIEVYWDPKCPYCDRLYHEAERLGALKSDSGIRWHFIPVPALGSDSYLPAAQILQGGAAALSDYMAGRPLAGEPKLEVRARVLLAAKHLQESAGIKVGVPYMIVRGQKRTETVSGLPQDLDAFLRAAKAM